METIEKTIATTPDLSWVTAAAGPELTHDGRRVTGLAEEDWWVWPDATHKEQTAGLRLNLHTPWTEPATGQAGTLLVELAPAEQGVSWSASFMFRHPGANHGYVVPVRGRGVAADFGAAHRAVVAWRPAVSVVDGVQLWTEPTTGEGEALGLASGELSWRPSKEPLKSIDWSFKQAGLAELMDACGGWLHTMRGTAGSLPEMIEQVSEARERIRTAMRNYLLNF